MLGFAYFVLTVSSFMLAGTLTLFFLAMSDMEDSHVIINYGLIFVLSLVMFVGSVCYVDSANSRKCECGMKIQEEWSYCVECGKEIPK